MPAHAARAASTAAASATRGAFFGLRAEVVALALERTGVDPSDLRLYRLIAVHAAPALAPRVVEADMKQDNAPACRALGHRKGGRVERQILHTWNLIARRSL